MMNKEKFLNGFQITLKFIQIGLVVMLKHNLNVIL